MTKTEIFKIVEVESKALMHVEAPGAVAALLKAQRVADALAGKILLEVLRNNEFVPVMLCHPREFNHVSYRA